MNCSSGTFSPLHRLEVSVARLASGGAMKSDHHPLFHAQENAHRTDTEHLGPLIPVGMPSIDPASAQVTELVESAATPSTHSG